MLFGYFTLTVALIISAVAAYYSIVGLTAIFAAAFVPIVIMGTALEVGKITAAVWLKINWARCNLIFKFYLVPAVAVLMLLTSMGIFGFLSRAHNDQTLVGGDVQAQLLILDERIQTAKDNIETNKKALRQLDDSVDQLMSRSTTEQGAERAAALRRSQQRDRARLWAEIAAEQKTISQLNDQAAPIRAQVRKVEAEVGPIKYIAALIYGDNLNTNLLEQAVRIVIIIIVAVFDPLALVLLLAAQQSLRWAREDRKVKEPVTVTDMEPTALSVSVPDPAETPVVPVEDKKEQRIIDQHPYLSKPWKGFKPWSTVEEPKQQVPTSDTPEKENNKFPTVPEAVKRTKLPLPSVPETLNVRRIQADTLNITKVNNGFGLSFPTSPNKGDLFVRVDQIPNQLYKFNGFKWIAVDKNQTDSYITDDEYVQFLIAKLQSGEYQLEWLTPQEQDKIAEKLQK